MNMSGNMWKAKLETAMSKTLSDWKGKICEIRWNFYAPRTPHRRSLSWSCQNPANHQGCFSSTYTEAKTRSRSWLPTSLKGFIAEQLQHSLIFSVEHIIWPICVDLRSNNQELLNFPQCRTVFGQIVSPWYAPSLPISLYRSVKSTSLTLFA